NREPEQPMNFTKNADGSVTLKCPQGSFVFTDVEFDDLVHAIPISTTHLYRLLIDTLIEGDDRKQAMRKIIEATGNPDAQLTALQNEALKHVPKD
ncbi:MAG: hypothetical protein KJ044_00820, partial [Planctomycetes bacterium]|nr:hypothetical protein [Planctomycetota bacterium]